MVEFEVLIIEATSIVLFLATTGLILLMILTRFKGMVKPPFWLYLFGGFLVITFHSVLTILNPAFLPAYSIMLSLIRLGGNFLVFFGIYRIYKAHKSSIKFDREIE